MPQPTNHPVAGMQMKVVIPTPGLMTPMMIGVALIGTINFFVAGLDLDIVIRLTFSLIVAAVMMAAAYTSAREALTDHVTSALSSELKYDTIKVDKGCTRFEASNTGTDPVYGALQRLDTGDIFAKQQTFLVTFIG